MTEWGTLVANLPGNVLVVGPSGVGKAFLSKDLRAHGHRSVDLDVVGFRTNEIKWKEWIIPPAILDVLAIGPRVVAVGACSNVNDVLNLAITKGWFVCFALGSAMSIRANRIMRGDAVEKQQNSVDDFVSWKARADVYVGRFPKQVMILR